MAAAGLLFLVACDQSNLINAFTESAEIRLQIGSDIVFRYDPLTCQISFNSGTLEFMAFNDNMSDYYSLTLDEIPTSVGQPVRADVTWTTSTDVYTRNNIAFEVTRLEGDRIWLWSSSARIGASLQVLD